MQLEEVKVKGYPNVKFLKVNGLKATQSSRVIPFLNQLRKERFEIAIEIGTQEGGFAMLLKELLKCEVYTIDIEVWEPRELKSTNFREYKIHYIQDDCFHSDLLFDLLKRPAKKILFCDGGHKANEISYFAPLMNEGDFIGGHDFFDTPKHRTKKLWTTHELWLSQIQGVINDYNLKRVYPKLSRLSVWCMFEKGNPLLKDIKMELPFKRVMPINQ